MNSTVFAITKRGRSPYIGSSWDRAGLVPQLFSTEKEAADICEKLTEVNPVGFCVMSVSLNISADDADKLVGGEFPQGWYDLHEHIVGHKILIRRGERLA
jgi:hypothetical protein